MLAEKKRQSGESKTRRSRDESRAYTPESKHKKSHDARFTPRESNSARKDEDSVDTAALEPFPDIGEDVAQLEERSEDLFRARNTKRATRLSPFKREPVIEHCPESPVLVDKGDRSLEGLCEIIAPGAACTLKGVPIRTRPVINAAELHRLFEEINMGHLPRSQTKFVVWYQKTSGGVFLKEEVNSVHQTLKSAYFLLKSGTVLKFNRAT